MHVTEDKRYTRDTHIRVDSEFDEKLRELREITGIRKNSRAIRYAVDFTVASLTGRKEKREPESEPGQTKTDIPAGEEVPTDISRQIRAAGNAEDLRRVGVEIQLLAESGKKYHYLSEEQVTRLMAYQRELTRMAKEMLKKG